MSKPKIGWVLSRTLKRDYGKRKNPLPDKLSFLSDIKFYAITKCKLPDSKKRQTRIEILPHNLKKLVESYETEKKQLVELHETEKIKLTEFHVNEVKLKKQKSKIKKENKELQDELKKILCVCEEIEKYAEQLEFNNDILMKNCGDDTVPLKSDINSPTQKLIEMMKLYKNIVFLEGGGTGLGK